MSERIDLLETVADTIKSYRQGELPQPTSAHVDRWLSQFTPEVQLPFLREFAYVMKQRFITAEYVKGFLRKLATNHDLAGANPPSYWAAANFLNIQQNGQSQKEMLTLFAECLSSEYGLDLRQCGIAGGDFIYLDDVIFSGNRARTDLNLWITNQAPPSARLHVIVAATHSFGLFSVRGWLNSVIEQSGKNIEIKYWRANEIENRKHYRNSSGVLWPTSIPNVAEVHAYMALPSRFSFEPRQPSSGTTQPFSSEAARQILESEFLIAGAKIRAMSDNPKPSIRPLGFSPFGLGFGSMIVTYRNCPNNSPLAMWWGDPEMTSGALNWYPLLQREGYSSARNVFGFTAL